VFADGRFTALAFVICFPPLCFWVGDRLTPFCLYPHVGLLIATWFSLYSLSPLHAFATSAVWPLILQVVFCLLLSMHILVTGASGFVGRMACVEFAERGFCVRAVTRGSQSVAGLSLVNGLEFAYVSSISSSTNWLSALSGVDAVIHLAGRAHVMNDPEADPLSSFRQINVDGTLELARQAASQGVRRFIFLSSIKVNGEATDPFVPFRVTDPASPMDAYAISKYEAEIGLSSIAAETGMDYVIVRPPLIYGPNTKGNFNSLLKLLEKGVPLPLASITRNRRSYISLGNLVDLLISCLSHKNPLSCTLLVSDGEDISTASLVRRLGSAIGKPANLFPVPDSLLRYGSNFVGRGSTYQRLCGSLAVDSSATRSLLGWTPALSLDEGFASVALGF